MVRRNTLKRNVLGSLILLGIPLLIAQPTLANSKNARVQLGIDEVLVVSLTSPNSGARGAMNDFLRNTVDLGVTSNNGNGFTAFMTTKTVAPDLVNTSTADTIPTLSSATTRSSFPSDRWGYSVGDTTNLASWSSDTPDDANGVSGSTYKPLVGSGGTPITVLRSTTTFSGHQAIFFGAKAGSSSDAGTYANTVIFTVISGISTENNVPNPTNPITPANDAVANNNTGTYVSDPSGVGSGATVYHYNSSDGAINTSTTIVAEGDTHEVTYTPPQGVSNTMEGTPLATGLAVTAAVAATSGVIFFILAKRKKDEEDEENDEDNYDY